MRWPLTRSFFNRASIAGFDQCWEWKGMKNKGGYGTISRNDSMGRPIKRYYAHHIAFEMAHGQRQPGLDIHHTCRNKGCVNPRHLVQLTHAAHMKQHRKEAVV